MANTPEIDLRENYKRNYLINGNFDFQQRGTLTSSGNIYTADRWRVDNTQSNTHGLNSTGAPVGSVSYYTTIFAASGAMQMFQALENANVKPLQGKRATFSCLLRKDTGFDGILQIRIQKSATPNDSITGFSTFASLDIDTSELTLSTGSASDWTRFQVSFDVPNDGTAEGLRMTFATLSVQAASNRLDIAQCMLQEGNEATDFVRAGGDIGAELRLCQRYYEQSSRPSNTPFQSNVGYTMLRPASPAGAGNGTRLYITESFKVTKRAAATFQIINQRGNKLENYISVYNSSTNEQIVTSSLGANEYGITGYLYRPGEPLFSSGNTYLFQWTADAEL